jgi:hypothetical protein
MTQTTKNWLLTAALALIFIATAYLEGLDMLL